MDLSAAAVPAAEASVTFTEQEIQEAPWGRWKTFDDPDGNGRVLQQNNPDFSS